MKRFIFCAAILGLVLGPVGQANADLITFEGLGLSQGDPVTTIGIATFTNAILAQVGFPEVAYNSETGVNGVDDITGNNGPPGTDLGSFYITDPLINGSFAVPSPITVTFDVPVTNVSFFVLDLDGAQIDASIIETVTAQIFGSGLVDTITRTDLVPGTSDGTGDGFGTWFNFNNSTPITTLALQIDKNAWGVDNLSASPVPEPGTLLLLGTGFVGMGTMVRRRSRREGK